MDNLKITFISQYRDIQSDFWKSKACSVVSLYMAIRALQEGFNLSVDELLDEALKINAWGEAGFWKHQSLAILAHNYGVAAYIEEYKSKPFGVETSYAESLESYGINKIYNFLKNKSGLIMVSIPKDFSLTGGPHTILLTGVAEEDNEKYFIYNDPGKESEEAGENLKVSLKEFESKWRRLAIFLNQI